MSAVTVHRATKETRVRVVLDPRSGSSPSIGTGLGFYDHMWTALAHHGGLGLQIEAEGDLHIDDHHTVEDVALAVGAAFDEWLGDRAGLVRFGHAYVPMDETLARAAVDLVARPFAVVELGFVRERLGQVATESLTHALQSFAVAARFTLHAEVLRGLNDHHKCEASFKAVGRALRMALAPTGDARPPSTKGTMG
jgi:imidazoleglycerol-phosphate dehydratase